MVDADLIWDINLRSVLRLWPAPTQNIEDMAACFGQLYDEDVFVAHFRPGKGGLRSADTRVIRNTREILEQAGLACRIGRPPVWKATPLGECVLSFLGVTGHLRSAIAFARALVLYLGSWAERIEADLPASFFVDLERLFEDAVRQIVTEQFETHANVVKGNIWKMPLFTERADRYIADSASPIVASATAPMTVRPAARSASETNHTAPCLSSTAASKSGATKPPQASIRSST